MRLLHVSDWHLGRRTLGRSRDDDFEAVLAEIVDLARDARPDLIVHSGDLFDTYRPATDDLSRGVRTLHLLADVAPTVVLAGNHDSPALFTVLDFMASRFGDGERRLRLVDRARPASDGGILEFPAGDGAERVRLAPLPFVHANRSLDGFGDGQDTQSPANATRDYAAYLRRVATELGDGLHAGHDPERDVLIFAAHLYLEGALPSWSERPVEISEQYAAEAAALPRVAYAALGHIHKPQAVQRAGVPARYAGSPLQLDFGEAGEEKTAVLVEAEPGRPTKVEAVPLHAGRRLAEFAGTLDELAARADRIGDAFVKVTVTTAQPTPGLAETVTALLPKATVVRVDEDCEASHVTVLDRAAAATESEPDLRDLFRDYLAENGTGGIVVDHVMSAFGDLLAAAGHGEPEPCVEETLLREAIEGEPA